MKTNRKSKPEGLPSRPEQLSTATPAPAQPAPLPQINFARRRANRELPTSQVIELIYKEAPAFFGVAEVVGKWVWIRFTEKQPREVTAALAQLGFHWNNKRQTWQHPCGAVTPGTESDPREKYPTYFPADVKTA